MAITFNTDYKNYLVFTHKDLDGMIAAFIIKRLFDNNLENEAWETNVKVKYVSYPSNVKKIEDDITKFKESLANSDEPSSKMKVMMLDYSVQPAEDMLHLASWIEDQDIEFEWIDHHLSAVEELGKYSLPGIQDAEAMSATEIIWREIVKGEDSKIVRLVSQLDSFDLHGEIDYENEVLPITRVIDSYDMLTINDNKSPLVHFLTALFDNYDEIKDDAIKQGQLISNYVKEQEKRCASSIYPSMLGRYRCLAVNSNEKGAYVFDEYDKDDRANYDLLVRWNFNGEVYDYSVYANSKNNYIDVGELCKKLLNGGGHKDCGGGFSKDFLLEPFKD